MWALLGRLKNWSEWERGREREGEGRGGSETCIYTQTVQTQLRENTGTQKNLWPPSILAWIRAILALLT